MNKGKVWFQELDSRWPAFADFVAYSLFSSSPKKETQLRWLCLCVFVRSGLML
jgi:hypothetical protein